MGTSCDGVFSVSGDTDQSSTDLTNVNKEGNTQTKSVDFSGQGPILKNIIFFIFFFFKKFSNLAQNFFQIFSHFFKKKKMKNRVVGVLGGATFPSSSVGWCCSTRTEKGDK